MVGHLQLLGPAGDAHRAVHHRVHHGADSTFTTAYDADQNPATLTEPGGAIITDTYNNDDELTGQSAAGAETPPARPGRSATTPTAT